MCSYPAHSAGDRHPKDTIRVARLAKETGIFPVFEAERGQVTAISQIRQRQPVEEYLRIQKRFAHLFGDHGRDDVVDRHPSADADQNIERYRLDEETSTSRGSD